MRGLSLNRLGELAGIPSSNMSRFAGIKRATSGRPETLEAMAAAWGVSYAWLAHGHGQPDPTPMVDGRIDRFPNQARAVEIVRDGGMSEEVIQAVLSEDQPHIERDPTVLWWIRLFQQRELLVMAGVPAREPVTTPVADSGSRRRTTKGRAG